MAIGPKIFVWFPFVKGSLRVPFFGLVLKGNTRKARIHFGGDPEKRNPKDPCCQSIVTATSSSPPRSPS